MTQDQDGSCQSNHDTGSERSNVDQLGPLSKSSREKACEGATRASGPFRQASLGLTGCLRPAARGQLAVRLLSARGDLALEALKCPAGAVDTLGQCP